MCECVAPATHKALKCYPAEVIDQAANNYTEDFYNNGNFPQLQSLYPPSLQSQVKTTELPH